MLIRNAMRQFILPLLSLLVACSTPPAEEPAVPTALQDPGAVQEIKGSLSRGGYDKDLVDALFADVLERDTALRSLMDALDDRRGAHGDSLENHRLFEQHNRAYYASALEHTAQLSDSVEREQQREQAMEDFKERLRVRIRGAHSIPALQEVLCNMVDYMVSS